MNNEGIRIIPFLIYLILSTIIVLLIRIDYTKGEFRHAKAICALSLIWFIINLFIFK